MKRNSRIFTAIMLVFSMLNGLGLYADATEYEDVSRYEKEVYLVSALGIMEGENSKEFFPGDSVYRAELIKSLMTLRNSAIGDRKQRYKDVAEDYYAFREIDEAVRLGYIGVDETRMFYPEEAATKDEALRLMLCMLGYGDYLYTSGYDAVKLADTVGLLDGLNFTGKYITKAELAKLIYNSFKCGLAEIDSIKGDDAVIKPGEDTTLSYLGYKLVEGELLANSDTSVYYTGTPAYEGRVQIGNTLYLEGETEAWKLIGRSVEAIVTDTEDTNEIICITQKNESQMLEMRLEDVNAVTQTHLTYNNTKKIHLRNDMLMIYNGVAVKFDYKLLKDKNGTVTFLNSKAGSFSGYNLVIVESYISFSVASVSKEDERIYFKKGSINERGYIDIQDSGARSVRIYKDGSRAEVTDITADNVVSISYAKGIVEVITVYVSDKMVSKKYNASYINDKDVRVVLLDDEEYKIAGNVLGEELLSIGSSYSFYLDFCGEITEIRDNVAEKNYCVLLRVVYDGIEEVCYLRLLTSDSKTAMYTTAKDKVSYIKGYERINVTPRDLFTLLSGLEMSIIITDKNEEGMIKSVTVPVDYDSKDVVKNEGIFTLYKKVTDSTMANVGHISNVGYADTLTFMIPPEENFDVRKCTVAKNAFAAGTNYNNITFYDVGLDGQAKAAVVRYEQGSDIDTWSVGLMLVSSIKTVINSDDEPVKAIKGYRDGKLTEVLIADGGATDMAYSSPYDIYSLKTGDILLYNTNSQGEITAYSVAYVDERDKNSNVRVFSIGKGYGTTRECTVFHAFAQYKSDKNLTLVTDEGLVPATVTTEPVVYKVNRGSGTVELGEWGEVIANNPYSGEKGSEMVVRTTRNRVKEVMIYED